MRTAPYGSWPSPVTGALMTSATVGLGRPTVDGPDLYWTESRSDQGGRTALWRQDADGTRHELTPAPFSVRTRVHEYGGGEYAVSGGVVVFSNLSDGRLYRVEADRDPNDRDANKGDPVPITPVAAMRYGDLRAHPDRGLVLAVREDHTGPGEAVNTVVGLDLDGDNAEGGVVLCSGADFYADPELGPDDRLAWTQWDHPAMPWDATTLNVGRLAGRVVSSVTTVAGGPAESALHPRWTADGTLVFLSDRTDWWNLYAYRDDEVLALLPTEAEFCEPPWQLGQRPYAVLDDDTLLVTWTSAGAAGVGRVSLSTGELFPLTEEGTSARSVSATGSRAAAVLLSRDRPPRLATLDLDVGAGQRSERPADAWTEVRQSSEEVLDPEMISLAQPVSWASAQGPVHGWFYPPTHAEHRAAAGTLPPLLTLTHGGPTASSTPELGLAVQYSTSRGIAVLRVNYGGSTGYGRGYRERLRGRWGVVDVEDCTAGALAMAEQGRADPHRLAIAGGSAGGYTTLRALTTTDVFHAGISLYGVGDLELLAQDTHKFESRYLDGLVGPYPEARQLYRERSPINRVEQLSAPILLLQGADDMVVPPNQAETMAAAAERRGLPVALIIFEGEGHGFRQAENIVASVEAQLYFLGRVFGFTPADHLPPIAIQNLPD